MATKIGLILLTIQRINLVLRYVSGFYVILSVLSIVGGVIISLMAASFIFLFIGAGNALLWFSFGVIIDELSKMQTHIELQTKFMRRKRTKSK